MSEYRMIGDPYLKFCSHSELEEIEARRLAWNIGNSEFYQMLDRWFSNFDEKDKSLALKILLNVQYFNKNFFEERIRLLRGAVYRFLNETDRSWDNVLLVLPDGHGDSADRHAYDLIKNWGLKSTQIVNASSLAACLESDSVLVFFNDTHGTGNQFLREMSSQINIGGAAAVFILAITIAAKAMRRFKMEIPDVHVVPDCATLGAREIFTASEYRRIQEIGAKIYPSHPVGYGESALLTAYYFQCPNNSLPLIWADGLNNLSGGKAFPWNPLFPYKPKTKESRAVASAEVLAVIGTELLTKRANWVWKEDEIIAIQRHIATWDLASAVFYETANRWFKNFLESEKSAAIQLFLATRYLNVDKIRSGIRELRKQILTDIKRAGGDISDILLVTTGDHKNSVYHYEYELLKGWGLHGEQVCSVRDLSQDKVIDKTLVFFYHTRSSANHFFKTYPSVLENLVPRAIFFAAYSMSESAKSEFAARDPKLKFACLEEVSQSVEQLLLPDTRSQLEAIWKSVASAEKGSDPAFLAAYYFQCPESSHPLLWHDKVARGQTRQWRPLFRIVRPPA
jgi:hypothetical protein